MQCLLSLAIFFCLLHSNTRADNDEIITDEDLKAFEEALADVRDQRSTGLSTSTTNSQDFNRRLNGRSKKVNARLVTTPSPLRKRPGTRTHLRRSGLFRRRSKSVLTNQVTTTTPIRRFNFRKTRRKPVRSGLKRRRISGDTQKPKNSILTRLLAKAERHRGVLLEEQDIEKSIFLALKEIASPPSLKVTTTTERSVLQKSTERVHTLSRTSVSPRHRGEIARKTTMRNLEGTITETVTEATSTVAALEALIAALENIEPKEFTGESVQKETTTTERTTTRRRATTTSTTTSTTKSPTSPPVKKSQTRARGFSRQQATVEASLPQDGPSPPPVFDEEAQKLSLEIEKNFIEETEPFELGPEPPALSQPSAPPRLEEPFAPPGAEPPSDQVVEELNEADDFLAVAKRLQLRRRQSQL